jgi:hypothetical protein
MKTKKGTKKRKASGIAVSDEKQGAGSNKQQAKSRKQ